MSGTMLGPCATTGEAWPPAAGACVKGVWEDMLGPSRINDALLHAARAGLHLCNLAPSLHSHGSCSPSSRQSVGVALQV